MFSFNQLTMVQLTIDNVTMQIQSPKSHITNLPARPRVPFVPFVPSVPDVRDVSNVRGVSANARSPKKTEHQEMRKSECGMPCRRPARQQGLIFEFGVRNLRPPRPPKRRPPLLIKEGSFRNPGSSKAATQNSIAFHAFHAFHVFQVFQAFQTFHFFHPFQPFRKRTASTKDETKQVLCGRSRPIRTRHSAASQLRNYLIFRTIGGFRV